MIKVTVSLPAEGNIDLREAVAAKLRVRFDKLTVLKKSLDARRKNHIIYTYTVAVEVKNENIALKNGGEYWEEPKNSLDDFLEGKRYSGARPIVVGAGPCGLFAALTLCKAGAKPIVLERGDIIEKRKEKVALFNDALTLDTESNIQFGEGGAGTFSDGKLNTGISSKYVSAVLKEFVASGAPQEILYLNKPHVGTDKLEKVVVDLRKRILDAGGEIHFNTKVTDIKISDGRVKGVVSDKGDFYSDRVYLCIGHSARDTFYMLYGKGIVMSPKIFSMGVRIEHLQKTIDIAQYGKTRGLLPPADYKINVDIGGGKSLYSFCMCPGGTVVNASSEANSVCVNGMSNYLRDGKNANSALLINVGEKEYGEGVLAGVELQRKIERLAFDATGSYRVPVQTYGDFVGGRTGGIGEVLPSVARYDFVDLNSFLPPFIKEGLKTGIPLMAKKLQGFDAPDAVLSGVEARSSSPVKILRDERFVSSVEGLYPLGEGAGYAGGITSAAADGIRGAIASLENI